MKGRPTRGSPASKALAHASSGDGIGVFRPSAMRSRMAESIHFLGQLPVVAGPAA